MYEWDLGEFFASQDDANGFCDELESKSANFKQQYEKQLYALSQEKFDEAIAEYEILNESAAKVLSYAHLMFSKDTSKGAILAHFEDRVTKIEENLLFFMLEFNALPKQKQEDLIEQTKGYEYYLSNSAKQKKYELSLSEERILLRTANTGANAFSRLFDESMARMRFDYRGHSLSEELVLAKLSSPKRDERKDAALSLSKGLESNLHLLTYILNIIRADLRNERELRGYEYPQSARDLSNQISKQSVDALIEASEARFDLPIKYYAKKREILGFEELYDYDRYAPLSDDDEYFSFEDAKKIVLNAFYDFDDEFGKIAEHGLKHGWCDVMPATNKVNGAFSHSSVSSLHPFILLNYTNKRRDIYTLAHELGHSIHQFLSYKAGYLSSHTPLTTAETASVFCEMLVFERIKDQANNNTKRAIIGAKLEDIFATLYRQINFTTFEREIHAISGELSSDELSEIWLKHSRKMFGDSLKLNEYYGIWWSYIPHFIHSPFYCYAYSYAQLLVLAIYGLYKSGELADFNGVYTEFLSLGGSKSPKDMVAMFGFDIESKDFWQIGINEIQKLVDEFMELRG